MKNLLAFLLASSLALAAAPTLATEKAADKSADKTTATNSQQNKMKECQTQAGDKKLEGKDRQAYVNNCLKAKPEPAKKESKMAMCNKQTAGLKGDERSKAQSECMKGG